MLRQMILKKSNDFSKKKIIFTVKIYNIYKDLIGNLGTICLFTITVI